MLIATDLLDEDPTNVRTTAPSAQDDDDLELSMRTLGQLVPIEVKMTDDGQRYTVVFGARRLRLARKIGLSHLECAVTDKSDAEIKLRQAAENMVRAPMEPIDTWQALRRMLDAGNTLDHASMALGLDPRRAKQLLKLADLDLSVVDAIRKCGMPDFDDLGVIAAAAPDVQRAAIAKTLRQYGKDWEIQWNYVASQCRSLRIPRTIAIFDVNKAGVPFDVDMFAEPGSVEEYTTTDVDKFVEAQRAALLVRIEKEIKKGFNVAYADMTADQYGQCSAKIPKGFAVSYDRNKKPKVGEDRKLLLSVRHKGHSGIGTIVETYVVSTKARAGSPAHGAPHDGDLSGGDEDDFDGGSNLPQRVVPASAAPAPPRTMTNEGLRLVAEAKTKAVETRLERDWEDMEPTTLLRLLVVALCGQNVLVRREGARNVKFDDLGRGLINRFGVLNYGPDSPDPRKVAAEALSRIVVFGGPKTYEQNHSGRVAETIGDALGADACMPRFDTEDALKTLPAKVLKDLAAKADISAPKTAAGLRAALTGKLAAWRPEEAKFHPGPLEARALYLDDGSAGDENDTADAACPDDGAPETDELEPEMQAAE